MKKRILALTMSILLIVCSLLTLASCVGEKEPDKPVETPLDREWYDNLSGTAYRCK